MTPRVARRLAWALWLLALGLLAAGVAIAVPDLAAPSEELGVVLAFAAGGAAAGSRARRTGLRHHPGG